MRGSRWPRRGCCRAAAEACAAGKKEDADLFDLIDPTKVNKHLQQLMPGLSIKVFRTYNASITLSRLLNTTESTLDVPGKKASVRVRCRSLCSARAAC